MECLSNIKKTLNFGFFIIINLTVFSPFNTFSQSNTLQFTEDEKVWISNNPIINVGNERYWPPIDFLMDGEAKGYSIDLMDLIANEIGIKINYVSGLSWSELLDGLDSGAIDVLPAISKTDEREAYIKFSKPYIKLPYVKVINSSRDNSDINNLEGKSVAVFKGSNIENALTLNFPNTNLVYLNSIEEALQNVSTGEVDVFIENLAVINYYLDQSYFPNVKLNSKNLNFLNSSEVFIGVLKKNEILGKLIDKGLDAVPQKEITRLKNKWLPSDKDEELFKSSDLWQVIIAILILFVISFFGFKWIFKRFIKEKVALEFGSKKFRIKTNFYLTVLVVFIAAMGWLAINYIEGEFLDNIELQLENDLKSANGRLDFWLNQKKDYLKSFGHDQKLIELTNDLIEASKNYNKEQYIITHDKLALFFDEHNNQGSHIINEQGLNIGSVDTSFVGNLNSIAKYRPELLKDVFAGNVVFVPPLLAIGDELDNAQKSNTSSMYFLIPIVDTRDHVIAAIIQEIDPEIGFSEILQLSHVGETGESYVFNREGKMLSKSRFENDLKNLGIYQLDSLGVAYIEIRDPGGNLTTGFNSKVPINQRSLTLMAKSAIESNTGVNVDGYNDYRGVPVMGAWTWLDKLELGLATEIDVSEALKLYYFIRLSALIVIGIALLLIIGSILFTLTLGEKANVALVKAKDELEEKVRARTKELNNEKGLLSSLINAIPDLIFFKDTEFKFLGANKAFEDQVGFKKEEFIGKKDNHFIPAELSKKFEKTDSLIIEKAESISMESEDVDPDGNKIVYDTKKSPFFNEDGELLGLIGVSRDITLKKKAEEEILKHTQELNDKRVFLNTLMNNFPDEIFYKDINYKYLGANDSFLKAIGKKMDQIIGKTDFELLPKKEAEAFKKVNDKVLKSLKTITTEHDIINIQGNQVTQEIRKTPFFNKKGDLIGLIGVTRDITERKKAELRLKSQSAALKSTANGVVITNAEGEIVWVNPALRRLTGYSWEELIGNNPRILSSGKHDKAFYEEMWKTITSGKTWHGEIINKKKNGELYFEEMTITPIVDDNDKIIQFVAIKNDITDRKKAEDEIKASESKFRSIAATASDAIISANSKGIIESWNNAAESIFGYSESEAIGKPLDIIIPKQYNNAHNEGVARVASGGKQHVIGKTVELSGQHKDGQTFPVDLSLSTWMVNNEVKFSGIIRDVTERKKYEKAIEDANKRMSGELNVAKDIQMSMLPLIFPAFPKREEIDIYAELIPAREVGGDFYDFYFLDETHLCFVMADVSGKGVPAALMMAVTKTLLKSRASNDKSTASILTDVNNEIAKDNDSYMFITVFMAILSTNTGELVYSNAGHNPSYVISGENKELTKLGDLHGPVIGAMEGMTYGETRLFVKKNDIIFSYTDGVTESHNIKSELFSDPRLEDLLQNGDYDSSKSLTRLVIQSVKNFEGKAMQFDDITAMAIKYLQNPKTVSSVKSCIKIVNDLKQITTVIEWFEGFALENKMPFGITQKINIAFDELLNNIISYGYNDDIVHEIDIDIEIRGGRLIIIINDDGIPFNPFKKDPPDTMLTVEERMIGGLGIHLVKKLMDECEYKRHTNRNIITLIKHNINS